MKKHFYFVVLSLSLVVSLALLIACGKRVKGGVSLADGQAAAFSGAQAVSGKVIADLKAYRIAYYEPFDSGDTAAAGAIQENDDPFTLAAFGPENELPAEIKRPSLYAVFSHPVVPLAKLGEPITESAGLFTIEPALKGVYRWYGSKLLSFEPEGDYLPQQKYTITVSDKIQSLGGKKLEGEKSFSFETERLSVLNWELGPAGQWTSTYSAHPEDARFIKAVFSYPVDLDEIGKWLEVNGGGRNFPLTVSRPDKIERGWRTKDALDGQFVLITLKDRPPADTDMKVTLKAGARSKAGWLGSKQDSFFSYHTLRPFTFQNADSRSYSSPRTRQLDSIPINVSFSYEVEEKGAENFFALTGLSAITAENIKVYGDTVILSGLPLQYEMRYELTINAGLKDTLGRTLGLDKKVSVEVGRANSYVAIRDSGAKMMEAGYPARYAWETQNPISIKKTIGIVKNAYEKPFASAENIDLSSIPSNKKYYFMEDLSPYLGESGKGSVGMSWNYQTEGWERTRINTSENWLSIQVTDIGITTRYAYNEVLVWATRLSTGEPIADAQVLLLNEGAVAAEGKTDKQGLAVFDFPDNGFVSKFSSRTNAGFSIKVVEKGGANQADGDEAEFRPNNSHNLWRFDVEETVDPWDAEKDRPVIFLFTDRGLYKPGETVTFRGVDRILSRGKYKAYTGSYAINASTGSYNAPLIASLSGNTTANGGSYGSFALPKNLDPGTYTLKYTNSKDSHVITFTVANFERLRFEASLKTPDMLFYKGDKLSMRFSANYLAGGALSGADYRYFWTKEYAWFNPGGKWERWRFGPETSEGSSVMSQGAGVLGPDGSADITQTVGSEGVEGAAYSYRLEATAQDAARQEISAKASVMTHPAAFYIGARLDSGDIKNVSEVKSDQYSAWFLAAQKNATLSWALVAPDGKDFVAPQNTSVTAQFIRYEWKQSKQAGVGGRVNVSWEKVEEAVMEKTVSPSGKTSAGLIPFTPAKSGQWEVRLRAKDEKGRTAFTRMSFYVSGGGWVLWGSDDVDAITLSPDKPKYAPGDTAKLLVRSPLPKGKYLLTIEREGILSNKIIELDGSARTIDIPIDESYVPIVYVALSSYTVRAKPPENTYFDVDLDKPKGVFGIASLRVDTESRHYKVEIEPQQIAYRPKDQAEVKLKVTLEGKPVAGAEVTFMAVDRGVVDLIDYHIPDPLEHFYAPWNFPLGVRGADSRSLLIDPVLYTLSDLQGGDSEDGSKLDERKDFRPTAVFEPYLVTGKDGFVTVKFGLPDSLTTYRCTAVAVGVEDFGVNEKDLRVSAPLTATPALPRKLRWRDTGTASLILTNLENNKITASVSLETEGEESGLWGQILAVDGDADKTVSIEPGATAEVRFSLAAIGAGEAKLIFTLKSLSVNERIIKPLLVDRPVIYETVSTIGNLNDSRNFVEEGVVIPAFTPEGTGSLSVTLAASRLALLKEAVQYLLTYPYGCLEQRTAALLPLIAFGDHLSAFDLDSPVKNPKQVIENELENIAKNRLSDGLFPYWPGGNYANVMVSLRIAHIALLAEKKGYTLPANIDAKKILQTVEYRDYWRSIERDVFIRGYWMWLRAMSGDKSLTGPVDAFLQLGDKLGIAGYGLAGLAAFESGDKKRAGEALARIKQFLRPGTRSVDLTDTYERQSWWGYDADRYAIALMLYYSLNPNDDMTTRLATSLIERQRRGVWGNTASSFWAVLAFGFIADAESAQGVNARGIVTLDKKPLLDAVFKSYGGTPAALRKRFLDPPLNEANRDSLLPLRFEREGSGVLYYTASLRYGIPAELASMRDEGIGVFAETLDADGNAVKDGVLTAGKTYTRRVTVSSSRDRTFLALRAPVPSGAEIVDAAFVTSSSEPPKEAEEETDWFDWRSPPLRFIMDDELRFHWDFFKAGRQTVEFRFRAVMPGVYPTPPAQAECMYEEEIFGRSGGELVRIGSGK